MPRSNISGGKSTPTLSTLLLVAAQIEDRLSSLRFAVDNDLRKKVTNKVTSAEGLTSQPGYRRLPAFQVRDLVYCLALPPLAMLAWLIPERWWPNLCRGLVHILLLGPNMVGATLLERVRAAARNFDLPVKHSDICVAYV